MRLRPLSTGAQAASSTSSSDCCRLLLLAHPLRPLSLHHTAESYLSPVQTTKVVAVAQAQAQKQAQISHTESLELVRAGASHELQQHTAHVLCMHQHVLSGWRMAAFVTRAPATRFVLPAAGSLPSACGEAFGR